jgi:hypothetical protein
MNYPKIDFTKMSCPPGLEFNKPYTLEEIKKAMKRRLIDNSYVAEWNDWKTAVEFDDRADNHHAPDQQYAAYASKDMKKGEIVMECMIPFEWLTGFTQQMKSYRITVKYATGEKRNIMPLGNLLVMNWGRDKIDANCTVHIPNDVEDRVIQVIASQDIKEDDELRWLYAGETKEKDDKIII